LLTDDGGRRVFQQQRRIETIVVDEELLITGVSVSEENQKVLNGVVSTMETVRKWWENAEQWCFSIGKTDERLLVTVFQQREENERLLVFQQRGKLLLMVFRQWKGKNETSAGRSCFGNKDDRGMAGWSVFGNGKQ
jgi:hypothetical protein